MLASSRPGSTRRAGLEDAAFSALQVTHEVVTLNKFKVSMINSSTADRYVSVPLDVLWSSCPKVSQLSGSLSNLRHLIMDDPQVKLSQDGSAVIVYNLQPGMKEDEQS